MNPRLLKVGDCLGDARDVHGLSRGRLEVQWPSCVALNDVDQSVALSSAVEEDRVVHTSCGREVAGVEGTPCLLGPQLCQHLVHSLRR